MPDLTPPGEPIAPAAAGAAHGEGPSASVPVAAEKAALRRGFRALRRSLPDRDRRSAALWDAFVALPVVADAQRIMVFDPVPGEPETADLVERCRRRGVETVVPEADPDPSWPDLVVVPGLAFTRDGRRLGQGGGWYDRFLARTRCPKVGVCFDVQVVEELPVEDHDVVVDVVVTESGPQ